MPDREITESLDASRYNRKSRNTRGARVLSMLFSICLALGAAEWLGRSTPVSDRLGWSLVPDVERRVAAIPRHRDDEIRILGLGDSFTEFRDTQGQNYLRFAQHLAQDHGRHVVVYNLGESGSGIKRYLSNLRRYAGLIQPDLVTVGIYLGNDLQDYELEIRKPGLFDASPPTTPSRAVEVKNWLKSKSVLANLMFREAKGRIAALRSGTFRHNLNALREVYGLRDSDVQRRIAAINAVLVNRAESDEINPWILAFGITRPQLYQEMYLSEKTSLFPQALPTFESDLVTIRAVAEQAGAPVVFVLIPGPMLVHEQYFPFFLECGFVLPKKLTREVNMVSQLETFFQSEQIQYVDTTPALRMSGRPAYIPDDEHWNVHGHRIAGSVLYDFLDTHGLLKTRTPGRSAAGTNDPPLAPDP